jgi:glycosyltransferase involved in cell wall biosynthesis
VIERRINQVLVGASAGDAITSMALNLRAAASSFGPSAIHAQYIDGNISHEVSPLADLKPGRRDDVIVYHVSYGAPEVTRFLLGRSERLVIVYHNITPSEYFVRHDPQFAMGLHWGRHELGLLRDRVDLAVADSTYNAHDLMDQGFADVHVIPAGLHPSRLCSVPPDASMAHGLRQMFPQGFVLSVSQVLPHKRFEHLLHAMHLVQWVHDLPIGLVIAGPPRMAEYAEALQRHARRLRVDRVWFAGRLSDPALATAYRMADAYATTSAHEGLALPPLEAMSFGVPVVARAAGALAETIGDAGLVVPAGSGPMLISEAITEVVTNRRLRSELIRRGHARVAQIESENPADRFVELLRELVHA